MVSRSRFVSVLELLVSGIVPAGGARRFFMVFGDGQMAAAVAALVSGRR